MMLQAESRCPDPETLAAWVEGRLSSDEAAELVEHASRCRDCLDIIDIANETFHAETPGVSAGAPARRWWLAIAAMLVVGLSAVLVLRAPRRDPMRALVEVAPRSARPVEARLSGGFAWAPYRGAMRADDASLDREQMKLIGVAAETLERAEREPSRDAQRAGAAAMVLIGRADDAIVRLAAQAKETPDDARAWSDLAAAQYAAALAGRAALYPEALASADRALRIEPQLPEALFNRALVLERMGVRGEARAAWQRYLAIDAASPWANEAREHLARLSSANAPRFETERERLEAAAAGGDAALVRELVTRHGERARAFGEAEYLGRWAEALQKKDATAAERWLATARGIGAALASTSGESLLRDAVVAIDRADAQQRMRIAGAHVAYRRGRIAFSRREAAAGEHDLRLAATQFAAAASPMALAARSYAAGARLAQYDVAGARNELTALLAEVDASRGYTSLAGQVRWELARAFMFDGDFDRAAQLFTEAEARFRTIGERVNEATVGSMLAQSLTANGQPDEAWRAHIRAFETFTAADRIEQLDGAIGGAAAWALRAGRLETARALVGINESLERGMANDLLLADTLVRKSLLSTNADAVRAASEATTIAMRLPDAALRARYLADPDFAMAAALERSDPRRARELATRAIDVYAAHGMTAMLAEPYLVRARAALRLGDPSAARADLARGIAAVEQHPMRIADVVIGTGVLDAGNALFEEGIALDLARGDAASALAHAERNRGIDGGANAVAEVRARLAGSGTAVLVIVALPRQVALLVIDERGIHAASHAIARDDLAALDDEAALFDALIRPVLPALRDVRSLIVVPDERLERVAFAGLRDSATQRTLIETMPVAIARSAFALRAHDPSRLAPSTITTVALPSGNGTAPLPEAELELGEIAKLYRAVRNVGAAEVSARAIEERGMTADVLHVAGHTTADPSADESLAIAGGGISWRTITAMRNVPAVVVLSACNTLRRRPGADRRGLSLGAAFVAAGAHDVIGTLAPIGDADARALFLALHEQLARGIAPHAALRHVQLAQRSRPGGAWRQLALLTTTIHRND
jgi:tetratricopeptide (TPR) repeat protein